MITNILHVHGHKRGYLPKYESAVMQPIFATANLAIRRETLEEVGPFDENCRTGEDVDLSIRVSKTQWEMFFEPRAVIRHKHRATLAGLLKQWYGYGRYHPYIFRKHSEKAAEIYYWADEGGWRVFRFTRLLGMPIPASLIFFLTRFYIVHLLYAVIAAALIFRLYWLAALAAALRLMMHAPRKAKRAKKRNLGRWLVYSAIRYVLNWTYIAGAFLGGLTQGVIYLEATRDVPPEV